MEGIELPCRTGDDVARVIRALGSHRYVAGRLLVVHAFAFDAVADIVEDDAASFLEGALSWSRSVLRDTGIDWGSRDERLLRASSEKEVAAMLGALWGKKRSVAQHRLGSWLERHELMPKEGVRPFDERAEEDMFPVLVDAGWELSPLAALDPERHRGAIDAFGERIAFETARFEETSAIPPHVTLHELSAIGPVEALSAIDGDGLLVQPIVLWVQGEPTYLDYVLRGVLRAAKLEPA